MPATWNSNVSLGTYCRYSVPVSNAFHDGCQILRNEQFPRRNERAFISFTHRLEVVPHLITGTPRYRTFQHKTLGRLSSSRVSFVIK